MVSKKLKLEFSDNCEFDNLYYIHQTYKQIVETKSTEIQQLVRSCLKANKRDAFEGKLAFSAVARENSELKAENKWQKSQLEDCYKRIQDIDDEHKEKLEEQNDEIKTLLFDTKQHNTEIETLLFENDKTLEKLKRKTDELRLVHNLVDAKQKEFAEERGNLIKESENMQKDLLLQVTNKEEQIKQDKVVIRNLFNKIETQSQVIEDENECKENLLREKDHGHKDLLSKLGDLEFQINEKKVANEELQNIVNMKNCYISASKVEMQEKIRTLNEEMISKIAEKDHGHRDLLSKVGDLEFQINKKKNDIEELENIVNVKNGSISALKVEIEEKIQKFNEELISNVAEKDHGHKDLLSKLGDLELQMNKKTNDIEELKDVLNKKTADILSLQTKFKDAESQLNENRSLVEKQDISQNELKHLQDKLIERDSQLEEKKNSIHHLETNVINKLLKIRKLDEELISKIDEKDHCYKVLLSKLGDLEFKFNEKKVAFEELQNVDNKKTTDILTLQTKLKDTEIQLNEKSNLLEKQDVSQHELKYLQDGIKERESKIKENKVSIQNLETKVENVENKALEMEIFEKGLQLVLVDKLDKKEENHQLIIDQFKSTLENETKKWKESSDMARNLEKMCEIKSTKLETLQIKVEKSNTERKHFESKLKVWGEEFRTLKKSADALEKENCSISALKVKMEDKIQKLNENLISKIAEKDSMLESFKKSIFAYQKELKEKVNRLTEEKQTLQNLITDKENIIENFQKAFNEQLSSAEVQNEQNQILTVEYANILAELNKCALENLNYKKYLEDGGAWVKGKKEEIETTKATLKATEDEVVTQAGKLLHKQFQQLEKEIQEQKSCKMCMDEEVSTVFLPCGHLCCCSSCANRANLKSCPICRVEIKEKLKVYQS